MTPFELETHFITKLAQLPKDESILGAVVIVSYPASARVIALGDHIDPMSAIFQTIGGICMEKGMNPDQAGEAMKQGLIAVLHNNKLRMAEQNR